MTMTDDERARAVVQDWWGAEVDIDAEVGTERLTHFIAASYAAVREETVDRGELWSFLRRVIDQGTAIQQDYAAGKYSNYEEFSARLDAAARERVDELAQAIRGTKGERDDTE